MKKVRDILAVQIIAKMYFDRIYGNSYHGSFIDILYKDQSSESLKSGMHYGYGSQWDQTSLNLFINRFKLKIPCYDNGNKKFSYLTSYLRNKKIPFQYQVIENCKKKDLK